MLCVCVRVRMRVCVCACVRVRAHHVRRQESSGIRNQRRLPRRRNGSGGKSAPLL
jgi:hypothetical protein